MSTIENAKRAAGWMHPYDRNACRTCAHGKPSSQPGNIGKTEWNCEKHGFYTSAMAVCQKWEAHA